MYHNPPFRGEFQRFSNTNFRGVNGMNCKVCEVLIGRGRIRCVHIQHHLRIRLDLLKNKHFCLRPLQQKKLCRCPTDAPAPKLGWHLVFPIPEAAQQQTPKNRWVLFHRPENKVMHWTLTTVTKTTYYIFLSAVFFVPKRSSFCGHLFDLLLHRYGYA